MTRELNQENFQATFCPPMKDIVNEESDGIDIWVYVRQIPVKELKGHEIYYEFVEHVYRTGDNRFDHVLVVTKTLDVYLVVVIELVKKEIYGHIILDLNREYGLEI